MSREASKALEDAVVEQLEDNDANVMEENGAPERERGSRKCANCGKVRAELKRHNH